MTHRITSISLIFLLVAPILLSYGWLQCQKRIVKKQVKRQLMANIDKSELVLLKFAQAETQTKLRWEHSREFEFEHQMYDIVESEIVGDSIHYWCWWDHEETALNQLLKELATQTFNQHPQNKKQQEKLINYLKSLYCIHHLEADSIVYFSPQPKPFADTIEYTSLSTSPPTPPPRLS